MVRDTTHYERYVDDIVQFAGPLSHMFEPRFDVFKSRLVVLKESKHPTVLTQSHFCHRQVSTWGRCKKAWPAFLIRISPHSAADPLQKLSTSHPAYTFLSLQKLEICSTAHPVWPSIDVLLNTRTLCAVDVSLNTPDIFSSLHLGLLQPPLAARSHYLMGPLGSHGSAEHWHGKVCMAMLY